MDLLNIISLSKGLICIVFNKTFEILRPLYEKLSKVCRGHAKTIIALNCFCNSLTSLGHIGKTWSKSNENSVENWGMDLWDPGEPKFTRAAMYTPRKVKF